MDLWFDLVSRVVTLHRVNLFAPFSSGQYCLRKIAMTIVIMGVNEVELHVQV